MWETAWSVIEEGVRDGAFPGAVAGIYVGARRETVVRSFGHIGSPEEGGEAALDPTDVATVYDLASVTKCFVTVAVMQCVERGAFGIDDRVARHLATFRGAGRGDITVGQLLTHTAGLPSVPQMYESCQNQDELRAALDALPPETAPGTAVAYTSLGYQYLGDLVEQATETPLDDYIDSQIAEPLGLGRTRFNPPADWRPGIAPTEYSDRRGRVVVGEVHDENCALLGGVQGHAGLFGCATDVLRLGTALVEGGRLGRREILRPETVALMNQPRTAEMRQTRSLGWVINDPNFGAWGTSSVSHTGFTGTSLCYLPVHRVAVVLLTNRVHPTRHNERIHDVRRRFHDAVRAVVERPRAARPSEVTPVAG